MNTIMQLWNKAKQVVTIYTGKTEDSSGSDDRAQSFLGEWEWGVKDVRSYLVGYAPPPKTN